MARADRRPCFHWRGRQPRLRGHIERGLGLNRAGSVASLANGDTDPKSNTPDTDADTNAPPDPNAYTETNPPSHPDADTLSDADALSDADTLSDADAQRDAHASTDPVPERGAVRRAVGR